MPRKTADESAEASEIEATLKTYVMEEVAAFLTGRKDIDADWDDYIKNMENIGLNRILELSQTAYDRLK